VVESRNRGLPLMAWEVGTADGGGGVLGGLIRVLLMFYVNFKWRNRMEHVLCFKNG
jgi:hypothetical protein